MVLFLLVKPGFSLTMTLQIDWLGEICGQERRLRSAMRGRVWGCDGA